MIKGGFQGLDISGVDLTAQSPTLPGGYAACAAADGKPIRVLTADGAVQCSVKKVSANYVLAGITGDGKILSVTVGSTDGISVSEMVIPEEAADEYLDAFVNISASTSENPYIAEYDGIVRALYSGASELSAAVTLNAKLGASHNSGGIIMSIPAGSVSGAAAGCFVKKGTILYCEGVVANVTVRIFPYKPVQS